MKTYKELMAEFIKEGKCWDNLTKNEMKELEKAYSSDRDIIVQKAIKENETLWQTIMDW